MMPALTGGEGIIKTSKTYFLEDADILGLESVKTGKITAVQHDLIKTLSLAVRTEHDYMEICDSLGVLLEMGLWLSKIQNLELQTGAT